MRKITKTVKWIGALIGVVLIAGMIFLYRTDIPIDQLKTKYTNEYSRFMPLMGMQVHYRDEGNPNDTLPLVLIHGTSASLHTWDSLVIRLKDKKRIISMDLPAFGLT